MKKSFPSVIVFMLAFALSSFAQTSSRNFTFGPNSHTIATELSPSPSVNAESKAYKNFRRAYPEIANEKWRQEDGYYFASFTDNNVKYKIAYTRDGHEEYTLKTGDESLLPKAIRASVKSVYFDYNITNVQEIEFATQTVYIVKINDANTWKTVKVNNDGIEEIENFYSVISPCR